MIDDLTPREKEIKEQLLTGDTLSQIAKRICLSRATVYTHAFNIYQKLGLNSRVKLMALEIDELRRNKNTN